MVAGWGLLGTCTFYAVVSSTPARIFGAAFLQAVGIWKNQPSWAPFVLLVVALVQPAKHRARRGVLSA